MIKPKVPAWPFCIWCGIVGTASGGLLGKLGIRNSELRDDRGGLAFPDSPHREGYSQGRQADIAQKE